MVPEKTGAGRFKYRTQGTNLGYNAGFSESRLNMKVIMKIDGCIFPIQKQEASN